MGEVGVVLDVKLPTSAFVANMSCCKYSCLSLLVKIVTFIYFYENMLERWLRFIKFWWSLGYFVLLTIFPKPFAGVVPSSIYDSWWGSIRLWEERYCRWGLTASHAFLIHAVIRCSADMCPLLFSACNFWNFSVKPHKGDALLFFSLHTTAIPDPMSLHGGCPVIEGEKWSATKWIHVDSFDKILGSTDNCTDANENCERWAALGECTKNTEYMVGSPELPGYCKKSCKVC